MDFEQARRDLVANPDEGIEQPVEVNQRGLIDKILARYAADYTVWRELLQNSDDAGATHVQLIFQTHAQPGSRGVDAGAPSSPSHPGGLSTEAAGAGTKPSNDEGQPLTGLFRSLHRLGLFGSAPIQPDVHTLCYRNNGRPFSAADWDRLRSIASGNPDETKTGLFGVGFYSLFSLAETPFVVSGDQTMAFLWRGDALYTRRGRVAPADQDPTMPTTFHLGLREPIARPDLTDLGRFLVAALLFTRSLAQIDVVVDALTVLSLTKTKTLVDQPLTNRLPAPVGPAAPARLSAPSATTPSSGAASSAAAPPPPPRRSGVLRQSRHKLFTFDPSQVDRVQVTLEVKQVAGYERSSRTPSSSTAKVDRASVMYRLASVLAEVQVPDNIAQDMIRTTKKPPPKQTRLSLVWSDARHAAALAAQGPADTPLAAKLLRATASAGPLEPLFSALRLADPSQDPGYVYIGFKTQQTTGGAFHLAGQFIPTVERENLDLVDPVLRLWNEDLLTAGGLLARAVFEAELTRLVGHLQALDPSPSPSLGTPPPPPRPAVADSAPSPGALVTRPATAESPAGAGEPPTADGGGTTPIKSKSVFSQWTSKLGATVNEALSSAATSLATATAAATAAAAAAAASTAEATLPPRDTVPVTLNEAQSALLVSDGAHLMRTFALTRTTPLARIGDVIRHGFRDLDPTPLRGITTLGVRPVAYTCLPDATWQPFLRLTPVLHPALAPDILQRFMAPHPIPELTLSHVHHEARHRPVWSMDEIRAFLLMLAQQSRTQYRDLIRRGLHGDALPAVGTAPSSSRSHSRSARRRVADQPGALVNSDDAIYDVEDAIVRALTLIKVPQVVPQYTIQARPARLTGPPPSEVAEPVAVTEWVTVQTPLIQFRHYVHGPDLAPLPASLTAHAAGLAAAVPGAWALLTAGITPAPASPSAPSAPPPLPPKRLTDGAGAATASSDEGIVLPVPPTAVPLALADSLPPRDLEASLAVTALTTDELMAYFVQLPPFGVDRAWTETLLIWLVRRLGDPARLMPAVVDRYRQLLGDRPCVPTPRGLVLPRDAYTRDVQLFQDLATIHFRHPLMRDHPPLMNAAEQFLLRIGVRDRVQLQLVFDRLHDLDWNQSQLITYLASAKVAAAERTLLANTALFTAMVVRAAEKERDPDDAKQPHATPASSATSPRPSTTTTAAIPTAAAITPSQRRYRASELYAPLPDLIKLAQDAQALGAPPIRLLDFPQFRMGSPEAKFLLQLGLAPRLHVDDWVGHVRAAFLSPAPARRLAHVNALFHYFNTQYHDGYTHTYKPRAITVPFIPGTVAHNTAKPTAAASTDTVDAPTAAPAQINDMKLFLPNAVFADASVSVLGLPVLLSSLVGVAARLGVAAHPSGSLLVHCIKTRPLTPETAKPVLHYLVSAQDRLSAEDWRWFRQAAFVPVKTPGGRGAFAYHRPGDVYLSSSSAGGAGRVMDPRFRRYFTFVDFGPIANSFLAACGSRDEPSPTALAWAFLAAPTDFLIDSQATAAAAAAAAAASATSLSAPPAPVYDYERYLDILRLFATHHEELEHDTKLWRQLQASPILLGRSTTAADARQGAASTSSAPAAADRDPPQWELAAAPHIYFVDDPVMRMQLTFLEAPVEPLLEQFYLKLGSTWISQSVSRRFLIEGQPYLSPLSEQCLDVIRERTPLILQNHETGNGGRGSGGRGGSSSRRGGGGGSAENGSKLAPHAERTLQTLPVFQIARLHLVYRFKDQETRQATTAALTDLRHLDVMAYRDHPILRESTTSHGLLVTQGFDWYDIAAETAKVAYTSCGPHDALLLSVLLSTPLDHLERKGWPVGRVLALSRSRQEAKQRALLEERRQREEQDQQRREAREAEAAERRARQPVPAPDADPGDPDDDRGILAPRGPPPAATAAHDGLLDRLDSSQGDPLIPAPPPEDAAAMETQALLSIYPDADPAWVKQQLATVPLDVLADRMLSDGYPTGASAPGASSRSLVSADDGGRRSSAHAPQGPADLMGQLSKLGANFTHWLDAAKAPSIKQNKYGLAKSSSTSKPGSREHLAGPSSPSASQRPLPPPPTGGHPQAIGGATPSSMTQLISTNTGPMLRPNTKLPPVQVNPQQDQHLRRQLAASVQSIRPTREAQLSVQIPSDPPAVEAPAMDYHCTILSDSDLRRRGDFRGIPFFHDARMPAAAVDAFLRDVPTQRALDRFAGVLHVLSTAFEARPDVLHIFWDAESNAIAFNRQRSLFFNARFYMGLFDDGHWTSPSATTGATGGAAGADPAGLPGGWGGDDHDAATGTLRSRSPLLAAGLHGLNPDAFYFTFMSFSHELAHNFTPNHDVTHGYYTSSIARAYMGNLVRTLQSCGLI